MSTRLQCTVTVMNREGSNAGRRALKSCLSIGRGCVTLSSAANKTGTRYRTDGGNLSRVFTRFCDEGKATVRFASPPHELLVRADPLQLKSFLRELKACLDGKQLATVKNDPPPVKVVPVKLEVTSVADLPSAGFPRTLQRLRLGGLRMCSLVRDVLSLKNLRVLDVADNRIERLPSNIGEMPSLVELNLSNNRLDLSNVQDWNWIRGKRISSNLKLLNLSKNNLTHVPYSVCKLKSLVTLKLDDNNLQSLPSNVGKLSKLRYLSASSNKLTSLPASIISLRLECLDISTNPWELYHRVDNKTYSFRVNSLVDIASNLVLKLKLFYASDIIPYTLVEYLDNARYCICGSPSFDYVNKTFINYPLNVFCECVVADGLREAILDCYVCSYRCFQTYISRKQNQPKTYFF